MEEKKEVLKGLKKIKRQAIKVCRDCKYYAECSMHSRCGFNSLNKLLDNEIYYLEFDIKNSA